jgi:hypothetical protein
MSLTGRVVRQAIPLAVVILGLGLAHQYASGAGVFQPESGLLAKAQAMLQELRTDLVSAETPAEEVQPSAATIPSEAAFAQQLSQVDRPVQRPVLRSTGVRRFAGCGH